MNTVTYSMEQISLASISEAQDQTLTLLWVKYNNLNFVKLWCIGSQMHVP